MLTGETEHISQDILEVLARCQSFALLVFAEANSFPFHFVDGIKKHRECSGFIRMIYMHAIKMSMFVELRKR